MADISIITATLNQPTAESHATKGKKGYQSKQVRASVNITFRVTPSQAKAIKQACKDRGVTVSQLVRAGLECYLSDYDEGDDININQLSIWSED